MESRMVLFFDQPVRVTGRCINSPAGGEYLELFVHQPVIQNAKFPQFMVSDLLTGRRVSQICDTEKEAIESVGIPSREDFNLLMECNADWNTT